MDECPLFKTPVFGPEIEMKELTPEKYERFLKSGLSNEVKEVVTFNDSGKYYLVDMDTSY